VIAYCTVQYVRNENEHWPPEYKMLRRFVNTLTERGRGRHKREQYDRNLWAISTEQQCTIAHKRKSFLS